MRHDAAETTRTCDTCGLTDDAGSWPDWVHGSCAACDPSILDHPDNQTEDERLDRARKAARGHAKVATDGELRSGIRVWEQAEAGYRQVWVEELRAELDRRQAIQDPEFHRRVERLAELVSDAEQTIEQDGSGTDDALDDIAAAFRAAREVTDRVLGKPRQR